MFYCLDYDQFWILDNEKDIFIFYSGMDQNEKKAKTS